MSSVLGWTYFFAWTLSFYPQVLLNCRRKTTLGFSTDKLVFDVVGFGCYSVYCYAFRYVPSVRASYEEAHHGHSPSVQLNGVAFGLHALALTLVQVWQVLLYDGRAQASSRRSLAAGGGAVLTCALFLALCLLLDSSVFVVLNWLYFLSIVKIAVTLVKFAPQMLLNQSR